MKRIILFILCITLACLPVQAQGADVVYVSPSGNDANSGTLTQPFLTVAHALAGGAETIILRGGIYPYLEVRRSDVTIKAFAGEKVIVRPDAGTFACFVGYDANNVTLQGIVCDASNVSNVAIKVTSNADNFTCLNCELTNSKMHGALISQGSENASFIGGSVHDNGGYIDQFHGNNNHGIYFSGVDGGLVDGVEIHRNGGHAVHIYGTCAVTTVQNSYIHDNPAGIGAYCGQVYILDNIFERDGNFLVRLQYNLEGALVRGNVLSFPNPGWTSVYIANINVPSVITVTGNHIHDSHLGVWLRNNGDPNVTVFIQSNRIAANTPVLVQNTNMNIIQDDNE